MRLPLFIALGVFLLGLILGSFLDLKISQAIASSSNMFGIIVAAIAPTIGFAGLCLIGGGFLAHGFQDRAIWQRIVFILLSFGIYGGSVYFSGREYFEVNGFNQPHLNWLGFLIAAIVLGGVVYLGYHLFKDVKSPYAWLVLAIAAAVIALAMLGGIELLKGIFHRPRFRAIAQYDAISFHKWWQPCKNYKDLMATLNLAKEEFKSFPSGHTGETAILLVAATFLPIVNPKLRKIQLPCFYGCLAFTLFVAFTRILVAAHFLSDVSMAGLIMVILCLVGNECVLRLKWTKQFDTAE